MHHLWLWGACAVTLVLVLYVAHAAARSLLVGIPPDYFAHAAPRRSPLHHVARMVLGGTLIVLGILMLVLPGPGLLTVAAGILLTDGEGKRALVRRILDNQRVRLSVDTLRRRAGQAPLVRP